jgi:hypothetical protein
VVRSHDKGDDQPDWTKEKAKRKPSASTAAFIAHDHPAGHAEAEPDDQ